MNLEASPLEEKHNPLNAGALTIVGVIAIALAVVIAVTAIASEHGASSAVRWWQVAGIVLAVGLAGLSYAPVIRASDPNNKSTFGIVPAVIVFDTICFIVGGLVIVSFPNGENPACWGGSALWGLACMAIGGVAGFLFGIPRSRREGRAKQTSVSQQPAFGSPLDSPPDQQSADGTPQSAAASDPSPIEQIADWLTKIIVGLGLVNLKQIPVQLDRWAVYVANTVCPMAANGAANGFGKTFALGLIIYFTILGFMSTYILTQVFLLRLVNQATTDNP